MLQDTYIQPLKVIGNERGWLMEMQRCDDGLHPGFGQVYITVTYPDIVKAWYCHRLQIDQIVVVSGSIKLVLYDEREESASYGRLETLILTAQEPQLIQIPPGIWHGFQALGKQNAMLVHLNSKAYLFEESDEDRLPYNSDAIPYRWQ